MTTDGSKLVPSLITPSSAPAMPNAREQKRRLPPPLVRQAIDLLLSDPGLTIKAAAEKVLLSRERLSRALGESHITAYVQQKAARKIAISSAAAAARMTDLIARGKSEHVQFRASEFVLGASGIAPVNQPQVSVNIDVKAGYVIDLSEPGQPEQKIVGGVTEVIDAKCRA